MTTSAPAAANTSPRGLLVKQLGETASFGPTQGNLQVSFAIDDIIVDADCTTSFAQPPENGHFLRLDMRVETAPDMDPSFFYMINPHDFGVVGEDGITESSLDTASAYSCLEQSEMLPSEPLTPASKYRGSIVLDTRNPSGVLMLRPAFMAPGAGWEWAYGT